jgi:methionyl-tRNA synthetase
MLKHHQQYQRRIWNQLRTYSSSTTQVITTPIFYVNGPPHIGHLYTTLLTDTTKHWLQMKQPNHSVQFITGTDEHGSKVQKSVMKKMSSCGTSSVFGQQQQQQEEINTKIYEYCTETSELFQHMLSEFNIKYNVFVRTTSPFHKRVVRSIWNELIARQAIYEGEYNGWYCSSDEAFQTDVSKVVDPITMEEKVISNLSGHSCEWLTEKNYKFKLTKYRDQILQWITENDVISPVERRNEIIAVLKRHDEFSDLSVSRSTSRVQWGIPVPNDPSQTIYVWLDALTNYITGSLNESDFGEGDILFSDLRKALESVWPLKVQVIGKDILKFHAYYWPAFLLALDLPLPEKFIVHPYWTVDRVKMSKSLGNVLHPHSMVQSLLENSAATSNTGKKNDQQKLTPDDIKCYIRYYLLREGNLRDDSNFSMSDFATRVNELGNTFGNLWMRMFNKKFVPAVPKTIRNHGFYVGAEVDIIDQINKLQSIVRDGYDTGDIKPIFNYIFSVLHRTNELFDIAQPWNWLKQLSKLAPESEERVILEKQMDTLMFVVAEALRCCALALYPVIPDQMVVLLKFFGVQNISDIRIEDLKFMENKEIMITENSHVLFSKLEVPVDKTCGFFSNWCK